MDELASILRCEPTPRPVSPDPRAQRKNVKLRHDVVYIVAGVVVEGDKVLLIQEAKPVCRGDWYLPAGRMEVNETIVEAVKREMEEEAGLKFEPEAVIAVECMSHSWIRITLSGKVTGGTLKTTAQADQESLQAGWFSKQELAFLRLRSRDILPLIEVGCRWVGGGRRCGGLPVELGHGSSSLRLIMVARDNTQHLVLVRPQETTHFPVVDIGHITAIREGVQSCGYQGAYKVHGVLSLEHLGRPHGVCDGLCVSVLVELDSTALGASATQCKWELVSKDMEQKLQDALENCAQLMFL